MWFGSFMRFAFGVNRARATSSCASRYSRWDSARWTLVGWAWPSVCTQWWRRWPSSPSPRASEPSIGRRWLAAPGTFCAWLCCVTPWPVSHDVHDGFRRRCRSTSRWPWAPRCWRSLWLQWRRPEGWLPAARRALSWVAVCASRFLWASFWEVVGQRWAIIKIYLRWGFEAQISEASEWMKMIWYPMICNIIYSGMHITIHWL